MDIKLIQELAKLMGKNGLGKIEIKEGETEISLVTESYASAKNSPVFASAPPIHTSNIALPPVATTPVSQPTTEAPKITNPVSSSSESANTVTFKSPMIGTFYRSPGPNKPLFVNVGDEVKKGQVLCIVEAMKLFNEIESDIDGKIVKVLTDDASPVEYDQALFLIEPA